MMTRLRGWKPLHGAQTEFLKRSAFEVLFYGGPGGGKTDALIVSAIQHVGRGYGKDYRAVLLRSTYPELRHTITRRTHDLYPGLGGTYDKAREMWRFPDGETVALRALPDNTAASTHSACEYSFIGFDNLSTFTEAHYRWMVARCRGPEGVPLRIRATQNPPHALDPAHEQDWVVERWAPWLDPKFPLAVSPHKALRFKGKDGIAGPLRGITKSSELKAIELIGRFAKA